MKIVITAKGNNIHSDFDLRFGRSGWFCVYDNEKKSTLFIENENKNAQGGAGTRTAEKVAELGAKQVISGDFGPKAKSLLERFNIQMIVINENNRTVEDIVKRIQS